MKIVMDYGNDVNSLKWFTRKNLAAIDLTVETKDGHKLQFNVREHGFRLWINGKELEDFDFVIGTTEAAPTYIPPNLLTDEENEAYEQMRANE